MDVRSVITGIHERAKRENLPFRASPAVALVELRAQFEQLCSSADLVGQLPPSPDTVRGRLGKLVVKAVQRMLFWYTPPIVRFQRESIGVLGAACRALECQFELIGELQKENVALRLGIQEGRGAQGAGPGGPLPYSLEFALQDHFRGSEQVTAEKLTSWLHVLGDAADARSLNGEWLDIGCGRGEWLALTAQAGRPASGIDSNPVSIDYCRKRQLRAERSEALAYLHRIPDGSLSVLTAFHVVEHFPMDCLLEFVALTARKLEIGGLLAIETPNPANVLMGSHYFWNDPTHQRPLPMALMEFVLEYSGLKVINKLSLSPAPEEEHLPYTEIDVIRRLDDQFYGPQDYGLVGCREA